MKHLPSQSLAVAAYSADEIAGMRRDFQDEGYVRFGALMPSTVLAAIGAEIRDLEQLKAARHFLMPGYRTPRIMHTVGGKAIGGRGGILESLYHSHALRSVLSGVAGRRVHSCSHPSEWAVVNFLSSRGATHGWHFDDPPLALVIILEAPPAQAGGVVEFLPLGVAQDKEAIGRQGIHAFIDATRAAGHVRQAHHGPGEAYLLRADKCLHRVSTLGGDASRRVAINFAFEFSNRPLYGATASLLYD